MNDYVRCSIIIKCAVRTKAIHQLTNAIHIESCLIMNKVSFLIIPGRIYRCLFSGSLLNFSLDIFSSWVEPWFGTATDMLSLIVMWSITLLPIFILWHQRQIVAVGFITIGPHSMSVHKGHRSYLLLVHYCNPCLWWPVHAYSWKMTFWHFIVIVGIYNVTVVINPLLIPLFLIL